jgi:Rieske Fe-S protein
MRRVLAAGVALLSLEFIGGTLAFTWPQVRSGLGGKFSLGTTADIIALQPSWAAGWPYPYTTARLFLINVPAAKELALGHEASVPNPRVDQLLALWRKCPHLGCQVPQLCEALKRFTCNCHQSTYNILGEKLKSGPASRGMDRFAVSVGKDGVIVVDSGKVTAGAPNLGPDHLTFSDPYPWDAACR